MHRVILLSSELSDRPSAHGMHDLGGESGRCHRLCENMVLDPFDFKALIISNLSDHILQLDL